MDPNSQASQVNTAIFKIFFILIWKNISNIVYMFLLIPVIVFTFFYGLQITIPQPERVLSRINSAINMFYISEYYLILSALIIFYITYQANRAKKIFDSASIKFTAPNGEIFALNQTHHILSSRAFGCIVQKNIWIAEVNFNPETRRLKIVTVYKVLRQWGMGLRSRTDSGAITLPKEINPQELLQKIGPGHGKLGRQE